MHWAIRSKHGDVAQLLLRHPRLDLKIRDKAKVTCFGEAVAVKDAVIAGAIKQREPQVVEEQNDDGMTHLHVAINSNDAGSVLFLLQFGANANAAIRDGTARTPLYMAIERGLDEVVVPLLRANADPSAADRGSQWTPAHMAATLGSLAVLDALIQARANLLAVDGIRNSILHAAVGHCRVDIARKILSIERCTVLATQPNAHGETPMHTLAHAAGGINDEPAASIFQAMLVFLGGNVNPKDERGNTPLYYALTAGAFRLAGSIVRNGGNLALPNADGDCCFDVKVPKPELIKLLAMVKQEHEWIEGSVCQNCRQKFSSVSVRKHHCRHCARVLCNSCSQQRSTIVKFGLNKAERVCDLCAIALANRP